MEEMFGSLLGNLSGVTNSWSPDPITRTNQVYRACYRDAAKSGDWFRCGADSDDEGPQRAGSLLRVLGLAGGSALAAWQPRTAPKDVRRRSRDWQDGIRAPNPTG